MDKGIIMPDYNHSILNLITSILKEYNVETKYKGLEVIDLFLKDKYKNIVLIVLDGMGEAILKKTSPNGLFINNQKDIITSVYPTTTAAAMTTYYSGKPPIETGWIAACLFFKEYGRNIKPLQEQDAYTHEKINQDSIKISNIIGYKTIYEQMEESSKNVKTYEIRPSNCAPKFKRTIEADNIKEMCKQVYKLCNDDEKKFILSYSSNPDTIIHDTGCYSKETKDFILNAEKEIDALLKKLQGTNTLLIISADHGHQDIKGDIDVLNIKELQDCLLMPAMFEPRNTTFFVKPDKKDKFEELFKEIFKDKYILYKKEELLKKGLLGDGKKHSKIDDFLGNYVAIAISDSQILLGTHISRALGITDEKRATHGGLTANEMEVPLIIFNVK